jgi:hypothetical protein
MRELLYGLCHCEHRPAVEPEAGIVHTGGLHDGSSCSFVNTGCRVLCDEVGQCTVCEVQLAEDAEPDEFEVQALSVMRQRQGRDSMMLVLFSEVLLVASAGVPMVAPRTVTFTPWSLRVRPESAGNALSCHVNGGGSALGMTKKELEPNSHTG